MLKTNFIWFVFVNIPRIPCFLKFLDSFFIFLDNSQALHVNPDCFKIISGLNSSPANKSLSDYNWTRTHNHLVRKWTLNHLAKLTKWLNCVVSTFLYGGFDCVFLSCYVRVSEWIHTLWVPLRTKWLWVQVQLQSLKLQISRLLRGRSSLTFRQL